MIIKIKGRKDHNFRQIVEYLHKEQGNHEALFTYVHNIEVDPDNQAGMIAAFKENENYRKKRKNGVAFFHDILSFSPEDSTVILNNLDMLRDLTAEYIQLRAPHAIAIARPHIEENHVHIHLIISGTERESAQSIRMTKGALEKLKQSIRAYQQEHYPQLVHGYQQGKTAEAKNTYTHATWQMENRGQVQDKKAVLKSIVLKALKQTDSWEDLGNLLETAEMEFYKRGGKLYGVIWQGKKYRFSTLIKEEQQQFQQLKQTQISPKKAAFSDFLDKTISTERWQQIQEDLVKLEAQRRATAAFWQEQKETKGPDLGAEFFENL